MDFDEIESKHRDLIKVARDYMNQIEDLEHDSNHMNDVVHYTKELLMKTKLDIDCEICLISSYWHDVGRINGTEGHEHLSSLMLCDEMRKRNYSEKFIANCMEAIENHTWNMTPKTMEGHIVQDADKLAWLGAGRWNACLEFNWRLDDIIALLPRLKKEILYFEESKDIYDEEIVKLVERLYHHVMLH